ncbi:uncharacterized protein [Typha angustifolia]|uniref:uncharacterized protein n=1 Tax=Typha angustifolia TaxID=59011 RepID=UPI003C2C12A6
MESSGPPRAAKQLWHIIRTVYYMMLKGISKHNLMLELHLLFKRGKIAGKAISGILTHHHHYHTTLAGNSYPAALSCRTMDPAAAVYVPREVEFSCSNTPSFPFLYLSKRKNHHHYDNHLHQHFHRRRGRHHSRESLYEYDAAAIAKVFEVLNDSDSTSGGDSPVWSYAKSPAAAVRHVRITDSPFPVIEEGEVEVDGGVDRKAEEFIRWFHEQQRLQQRGATPNVRYWD